MIGNILYDKKNQPINASPIPYSPSQQVKDLISRIRKDYGIGYNVLNKVYRELNDRSVIQTMADDQRTFNAFVPPRSLDPDDAWRASVLRPMTRNKIISIAAHITATLLFPNVVAENNDDEEDEEAAEVMKTLIEWHIRNSDYEMSFLSAVIAALIQPAAFIKVEFAQAIINIRQQLKDGSMSQIEAIDAVFSGFQIYVVSCDEMFIANAYQPILQRQRFLGRRRFIDYEEAKSLYGGHKDFELVRPGARVIFSQENNLFYQMRDYENPTLVEEFIYYNRQEDLELTFINGILISKPDQPMRHRRFVLNKDGTILAIPMYPFAKTGFEPLDERRFFYYKSCVSKLGPEQEIIDTLYRMIIDGTYLSIMPPLINIGPQAINSSIYFPGSITNLKVKAEIQNPVAMPNLGAGLTALQKVEESLTESSLTALAPGPHQRTAMEIAFLEQQMKIQMGFFAKMIAELIKEVGYLMIDGIVQHQTVADVEEITAGEVKMKFRTFLLHNQNENGKRVNKKIKFTDDFMGRDLTAQQIGAKEQSIFNTEGGLSGTTRLYLVNPYLFARMRFMVTVTPDELAPQNEALRVARNLEAYDRMIQNPYVNQEEITKEFLVETFSKGNVERFMKNPEELQVLQKSLPDQLSGQNIVPQASSLPSLVGRGKPNRASLFQ